MQLSTNNLNQLPATIKVPSYDREQVKVKMLHLGFGAFHRAHQAIFADILATEQQSDWGFCEVNLVGGEQQIEDLLAQDCLYNVVEMQGDNWQTRTVGVVKEALHPTIHGIDAVINRMLDPNIAIVSMTVTEKGYCYVPATGSIDFANPAIAHDLASPNTPKSLPGLIVEALKRRKVLGITPFTVMSCDNMPENGHITKNVILAMAAKQDIELANWIEANVTFPSTMVDRIVPAMTPDTAEKIQSQLGPVVDKVAIACEPFRQWVIEDNFVAGRPEWEKAGAQLVTDVVPFEEMKLRMLNGSHSFLAYLGYLAGYQYINECMQDSAYEKAAYHLMVNEQAPTLSIKNVDLPAYANALIERFKNTGLKHRTWQIAMDGTLKLSQRLLDSIQIHLKNGQSFDYLALAVAGWMRYVSGKDDHGAEIQVSDPQAVKLAELVANSTDDESRVRALLSLNSLFTEELVNNSLFTEKVTAFYLSLRDNGAKKTIEALNHQYTL
ncbi:mannitol dehydrogenase family protein [Providencia rettgeri]|uniref:mannitol dehydrogenase family protein n=1 Tax=Providencia TaxID=586 RepID=UPI000BCBCB41|nr:MULTISPECIES: mannitol dehydrogenase family protein [Providencia]MBW3106023.1 mannitol dehydrogenase family protein [Providencia rettgeri]PCQ39082.1 D-mannonate oxidoreductase [Providencia rettgeri]BBU98332.1 D-mannonate oxidoreductase [Providencia rettgeri]